MDPKTESLFAIKGLFALEIFDDLGVVTRIEKFGTERYFDGQTGVSVELSSVAWHTVVALIENSVLLEIKEGSFISSAKKRRHLGRHLKIIPNLPNI